MTDYYSKNPRFYVGIDCIIFGFEKNQLSLLLLQRNFEPAKGQWSLMGGFVQENESADDAAKRVLFELTGLKDVYMEQIGAFGEIHRDPGERVISLAYYALININEYDRELVSLHNAHWMNINELPDLIFDHNQMVEKARNLKPSARGELEITDLNRLYLEEGRLNVLPMKRGNAWLDAGTPQSLLEASNFIGIIEKRQDLKIACIEEIAYRRGFISSEQLLSLINELKDGVDYKDYLKRVYEDYHEGF